MQFIQSLKSLNPKLYNALHIAKERYAFGIRNYKPKEFNQLDNLPNRNKSAWQGLELIVADVIRRSGIELNSCLEFGVEYGYSTAVFANYFNEVTGVDLFTGDIHSGYKENIFERASENLKEFKNIRLIKSDYKDFITGHNRKYDLIHVDIVHTYEDTYACGLWSALHSSCTLFHDTESFFSVKKAVSDIAKETNKRFYNYPYFNGLGILF
jgi:hypothetical protein